MNSFFDKDDTIDLRSIANQYNMIPSYSDIPYFTDNEEDYEEDYYQPDIIIQTQPSLNEDIIINENAIMFNDNEPSSNNNIIIQPLPTLENNDSKERILRILNEYQHQQKEQYMRYPLEKDIDLGERDNYLQEIQKQIQMKRQFLSNKQSELKENIKTNDFLRGVKDDYNRYHNFIQKERKEQYDALNTLKQYSEDLRKNTEMTQDKLAESIRDQKYIVDEMNALKKTLDDFTCP